MKNKYCKMEAADEMKEKIGIIDVGELLMLVEVCEEFMEQEFLIIC